MSSRDLFHGASVAFLRAASCSAALVLLLVSCETTSYHTTAFQLHLCQPASASFHTESYSSSLSLSSFACRLRTWEPVEPSCASERCWVLRHFWYGCHWERPTLHHRISRPIRSPLLTGDLPKCERQPKQDRRHEWQLIVDSSPSTSAARGERREIGNVTLTAKIDNSWRRASFREGRCEPSPTRASTKTCFLGYWRDVFYRSIDDTHSGLVHAEICQGAAYGQVM